ncbi:hypothetical protein LKO27_09160 [Tessaracoccus sp. OS52]|uniref:hypothetical protein n=1 Tax=Tessaracoccus sp. OS52 TaxID=2886691 RepID=UPI001D1176A3|nr:hypothetical protein [Tessaracoccus sp. OS52]MCC2593575.1 hypothetical protein [Tessaracoccus sp. OS52]
MAARFLDSKPCQDACGVMKTGEFVEGAPVYSCPGCDTRWIELAERRPELADPPAAPTD